MTPTIIRLGEAEAAGNPSVCGFDSHPCYLLFRQNRRNLAVWQTCGANRCVA